MRWVTTASINRNSRMELDVLVRRHDKLQESLLGHNGTMAHEQQAINAFWSVSETIMNALSMDAWQMSCDWKINLLICFWLFFVVLWHGLCLEAWLGFRYVRAFFFMWRWERNNRHKIDRSIAEAKQMAMAAWFDDYSV